MAGALRRRPRLLRLLRELARAIPPAGGALYLVGGYLRNIVEGREPGDVDLLVTGLSHRRIGELLRSLARVTPGIVKVVAAGRHFPVHRIAVEGEKEYIDVSSIRAGSRTVKVGTGAFRACDDRDAVADAARRDFTFDALLVRLSDRHLVGNARLLDPFGGIEDLRRKRIRCVGKATDRFREDPLRIVRAIRLKNERHGFTIDPSAISAIRRLAPGLLPSVSPDRLSVELVRSLSADPAGTIDDLRRFGLQKILMPEWGRSGNGIAERVANRYRFLRRSSGTVLPMPLLLGNLLADLPLETALAAARRMRLPGLRSLASMLRCLHVLAHTESLRFPKAETEEALLSADDRKSSVALYRAVRLCGKCRANDLNRFMKKCLSTPYFISGKWLDENGFSEGPIRREILLLVREETLAGKVSRTEEAARLAEAMRQGYNRSRKRAQGRGAT